MSQDFEEAIPNSIKELLTLSKDIETEGFDSNTGETWVYPTNYPLRDYQFNIIQKALLENTLVSLPTGLGKTLIAAVVMYNFYRWYPTGKIIFMAPTKPLVKQQIEACYNIMAIPKECTAELTGSKAQMYRREIWLEKRVFFITPQILQNDLNILTKLGKAIKCVVFDEAHKAKGNHAYCEVIRKLNPQNKYFRVLALSATPGSSLKDVLEVIHNLLISHLEIRTHESLDVSPYVFSRSLETVVVPLSDKISEVRDAYIEILERQTRILMQHKILTGNCSTLTKGKIFMTMKNFKERNQSSRDATYGNIMRCLNICVTLYHAFELLIRHGLRSFLSFYEEHKEKPLLRGMTELHAILSDIAEYLGPIPSTELLPNGSPPEISEATKFGHPKYYKLKDILCAHFSNNDSKESRVIVFCEYRESVMEAFALLLRYSPLIKAKIFMGKGAITQKQQLDVVRSFRMGECNTLISTCIGEEGLDVGEVDLIICFDISNKSPIRMVQRMGRTGRKRQGRIIVLVTEGKEQETLKECLIHKENLTNHILQSKSLYQEMYRDNPRMIPNNINLKCEKMFITVKEDPKVPFPNNTNSIKDLFNKMKRGRSDSDLKDMVSDVAIEEFNDKLPIRAEYWNKNNPLATGFSTNEDRIDFSTRISKNAKSQSTGPIGHSNRTRILVSLLQLSEYRQYNIPLTQIPVMPSQVTKAKRDVASNNLIQTDIRSMFYIASSLSQETGIEIKSNKQESEPKKEILKLLENDLMTDLTGNVVDQLSCPICDNLFSCSHYLISKEDCNLNTWFEPDHSILESLNERNLQMYLDSITQKSELDKNKLPETTHQKSLNNLNNEGSDLNLNNDQIIVIDDDSDEPNNFDGTIGHIQNSPCLNNTPFKNPKSFGNVLRKFYLNDTLFDDIAFAELEKPKASEKLSTESETRSFDRQNGNSSKELFVVDIESFNEAEFTPFKNDNSKSTITDSRNENCPNSLSFFNISSIENIFDTAFVAETIEPLPKNTTGNYESDESISYSPLLFEDDEIEEDRSTSPILSTPNKAQQFIARAQQRLFNTLSQESIQKDLTTNEHKIDGRRIALNISPDLFDDSTEDFQENIVSKAHETTDINAAKSTYNDKTNFSSIGLGIDKYVPNNRKSIPIKEKADSTIFEPNIASTQTTSHSTVSTNKENVGLCNENSAMKVSKEAFSNIVDFCDRSILDMFSNNLFKTKLQSQTQKTESNKSLTNDSNKKPLQSFTDNKINKLSVPNGLKDTIWNSPKSSRVKPLKFQNHENVSKVICLSDEDDIVNPLSTSPCLLRSQRFQNDRLSQNGSDDSQNKLNENNSPNTGSFTSRRAKFARLQLIKKRNTSGGQWISRNKDKLKSGSNLTKTNGTSSSCDYIDSDPPLVSSPLIPCKKINQKNKIEDSGSILNNHKENNGTLSDLQLTKDDFEIPTQRTPQRLSTKKSLLQTKKVIKKYKNCKKKLDNSFLDLEAEVSCIDYVSDSEEELTQNDKFEESFVDDNTENVTNNTVNHAHYLKSVRSPLLNRGMFKIPTKPKMVIENVFSQVVNDADNNYINDTFCVDEDNTDVTQEGEELSDLEIAELILKQKKKKRKKRKKKFQSNCVYKRPRILSSSSASDN